MPCIQICHCRLSRTYVPCAVIVLEKYLVWNISFLNTVDNRFSVYCRQVICFPSKFLCLNTTINSHLIWSLGLGGIVFGCYFIIFWLIFKGPALVVLFFSFLRHMRGAAMALNFSCVCRTLLLLLSRFSCVRLCATPETAAHQAPLSLGFSRQEFWSGLPFPSPMHESEKWKWSRSVVPNS